METRTRSLKPVAAVVARRLVSPTRNHPALSRVAIPGRVELRSSYSKTLAPPASVASMRANRAWANALR